MSDTTDDEIEENKIDYEISRHKSEKHEKEDYNANIDLNHPDLKDEPIKSGESKFKVFSFEPSQTSQQDTQKCIDFWKAISAQTDIKPMRGFKLRKKSASEVESSEYSNESLTWTETLHVLKKLNMHKTALMTGAKKCNICTLDATKPVDECNFTKDKNGKTIRSDGEEDFDLSSLNTFEPFKKYYTTVETMTDEILYLDEQTSTTSIDLQPAWIPIHPKSDNLVDNLERSNSLVADSIENIVAEETSDGQAETELSENIMKKFERLDALVGEFSEMYNIEKFRCICVDGCMCLYQSDEVKFKPPTDKNVCSCGHKNCLCSDYARILKEIEDALGDESITTYKLGTCSCDLKECTCAEYHREMELSRAQLERVIKKTPLQMTEFIPICECDVESGVCECPIQKPRVKAMPCSCGCGFATCKCKHLREMYAQSGDYESITGEDQGDYAKMVMRGLDTGEDAPARALHICFKDEPNELIESVGERSSDYSFNNSLYTSCDLDQGSNPNLRSFINLHYIDEVQKRHYMSGTDINDT